VSVADARSPLSGFPHPGRHGVTGGSPGVVVKPLSVMASATVIARPNRTSALMERGAARFGLALTDRPVAAIAGGLTMVGVGPGKWLAFSAAGGPDLSDLREAFNDAASVIAQTGGYALVRVSGPRVLDMLAKCVALDLAMFKLGDAATTQAHHMGVTLWKADDGPAFDMAVFRSTIGSFWHMIEVSGAEYGVEVSA
jgi:methylglutamate dehydrogenase subunit D